MKVGGLGPASVGYGLTMMTGSTNPQTIVEVLMRDHGKVEALLARLDSEPQSGMEQYFCELREELVRHEVAEEMIVYPAFRTRVPLSNAIADARVAEQAEAERVLADLDGADPTTAVFRERLTALRSDVLTHARAEENEVFPLMKRAIPHKEMVALAENYEKALMLAPTHPHPHAPDTPPGNIVLGPIAALVDHFRDAMRGAA